MKMHDECLPCLVNQVIKVSKMCHVHKRKSVS